jgi:hypothetical protein
MDPGASVGAVKQPGMLQGRPGGPAESVVLAAFPLEQGGEAVATGESTEALPECQVDPAPGLPRLCEDGAASGTRVLPEPLVVVVGPGEDLGIVRGFLSKAIVRSRQAADAVEAATRVYAEWPRIARADESWACKG